VEKIFWILIERYHYSARTSLGRMSFLYDNKKEYFGNTLEDTARPSNIKIYGETCLPPLECNVALYESPKFGKTIIFYTEPDKVTIKAGILSWVGCLAHGGQTHKDTAGCVIVAENILDLDTVQGSLKDKLRLRIEEMIKKGYTVKGRFINLNQLQ
jgi:hypothetical protein